MKRILYIICFLLSLVLIISCGRNPKSFAGAFTDEFGNRFVLNDDSTATIQFAGFETIEQSNWHVVNSSDDMTYTCIYYNGDSEYYYLYNNKLYRYKEDMIEGRRAINIVYEE